MKYDQRARPFWEKHKPGPISKWQAAHDRADILSELLELYDTERQLMMDVRESKITNGGKFRRDHHSVGKLIAIQDRVDELRAEVESFDSIK